MKPEKQMRVMQICFVAYAVLLIGLAYYLPTHASQNPKAAVQISMGLIAVFCAFAGFLLPKMMARTANNALRSGKIVTPMQRWRAGHVLRFAFDVSILLFGFVLHILGGAAWLVGVLFAGGLILLLIWKPGTAPAEALRITPPNL